MNPLNRLDLTLRRALPTDAEGIHSAHMRSIREICAPDYTAEQIAAWGGRSFDQARRIASIENDLVWVIAHKDQVFGFSHLKWLDRDSKKIPFIMGLYFTPEIVGSGFGRAMIAEIERAVRDAGHQRIELESTLTSVGFYERMGYERAGPMTEATVNGVGIPCFPMVKTLPVK